MHNHPQAHRLHELTTSHVWGFCCGRTGPASSHVLLLTLTPPASLGTLPPPHLLTSVSLTAATHTGAPITTSQQQSGTSTLTNTFPANTLLPQPAATAGLTLSSAAQPFPRKLVDKVNSGQFIEMRELLADNISLLHQLETIQGYPPLHILGPARPRLRDVTSLSTWCYCFMGYMAIRTSDTTTRDQLAYGRLILREALRHGGVGWLDYDRAFRQQAAADPTLRWNTLLPGLQASTMLSQRSGQDTLFCTLCREVDHTRAQCALQCLNPPMPRSASTFTPAARRRSDNICLSWNRGACTYPGYCTYRHVCATCQLTHKARDCPRTPNTSSFKQARGPLQHSATQATLPTTRP